MTRFIKFNLLIIFLLLAILIISCKCQAEEKIIYPYKEFKPFKMVFLPDIHLSFKSKDSRILYRESLVILQDVIKNLNLTKNPDFTVFGGNLTNNDDGEFSDMPMFLDTFLSCEALMCNDL